MVVFIKDAHRIAIFFIRRDVDDQSGLIGLFPNLMFGLVSFADLLVIGEKRIGHGGLRCVNATQVLRFQSPRLKFGMTGCR